VNPSVRPSCPSWLEEHWQEWGREFSKKLEENPHYTFAWKQWQGQRVNHRLLPLLQEMTQNHCAYCDWFPADTGTDPTIDHFKPKARFPRDAYHWPNLYFCCRSCQEKDDKHFSEDLLRPDEEGYSFERYFIYNYRDGTIDPNPAANEEDRRRAVLTRDHLRLNSRGRPASRLRELERFRLLRESDRARWLADSPFRFILVDELDLTPSTKRSDPEKTTTVH
jgi:uncharacterized protein (TIGR02646 family)